MIDIAQLLNTNVSRRTKAWDVHNEVDVIDRRNFVTSSEVGKCLRAIWYSKYPEGYSDAERSKKGKLVKGDGYRSSALQNWGFSERGNAVERWVTDTIAGSRGVSIMFTGKNQRSFVYGLQAGTPDGILIDLEPHLLEIKSFDPRSKVSSFPKQEHLMQVQQNMYLLRSVEPTKFMVKDAILFYINASDFMDSKQFVIEYNADIAETLLLRAEKAVNSKSANDAPPEGIYTGECKFCRYSSMCSGAVQATKEEVKSHEKASGVASRMFGKR